MRQENKPYPINFRSDVKTAFMLSKTHEAINTMEGITAKYKRNDKLVKKNNTINMAKITIECFIIIFM